MGRDKKSHVASGDGARGAQLAERTNFPRPMTVYSRLHQAPPPRLPRYSWENYTPREKYILQEKSSSSPTGSAGARSVVPMVNSRTKKARGCLGFFTQIYGKVPANEQHLGDNLDSQSITYPTGWAWFLLLLSGALPYIVVVLDDTIIATIIPILISEFHAPQDIGWYASAYFLPLTVLMPVFGKCYSLWKVKWLFLLSLMVLLIGSILCATTVSSAMFIAGRAIAGAGAAGVINGSMRIVGLSSPRKQRTFLEAAGAFVMGGCTVAGPVLGGVIADKFSWRWAFWVNVPIALGAILVVLSVFPKETPRTALFQLPNQEKIKRLDPIGAVTLTGSLCCLITLLQFQATSLELDSFGRYLAIATGAGFSIFAIHETFVRADLSLVPKRIFRQRAVWSCCLILFFLFAGFIDFVFFLSVFFQSVIGESAQESALSLLPYVIAVSLAAILVGVAVSYVHYYNPFFTVGGVVFVVGSFFVSSINATTSPVSRALFEATLGAGVGFITLANVAPCHIQLDEKDHAIANGLLFMSSLLGATLSLPISSALFNRNLIGGLTALDVPLNVKFAVLSDPTKTLSSVPQEFIPPILQVLLDSVHITFLFGLGCAISCAILTALVPYKRLIVTENRVRVEGRTEMNLRRLSTSSALTSVWIQQALAEQQIRRA
ncbi:MFS general substrate transporter [Thozetella sp. PMI_491]|nr:MFS general substrate transporter [Thozetella sp. PMI_491]